MRKSIRVNLKKYIKNKNYVRYFENGKEYIFSFEAYTDYCTAKRYYRMPMYKKLDGKHIEVRHSKGGKVITEANGLYPAVIFVRPYWCKEVK